MTLFIVVSNLLVDMIQELPSLVRDGSIDSNLGHIDIIQQITQPGLGPGIMLTLGKFIFMLAQYTKLYVSIDIGSYHCCAEITLRSLKMQQSPHVNNYE